MTPEQVKSLVNSYKQTFIGQHGDKVLDDLSKQCYEHDLTYIDGNPNATAFNEGKRFVILHIRRLVDAKEI